MKQQLNGMIENSLNDISMNIFNWFVGALPDIVGYSALATGIFMMLSSLLGKGIIKPLGVFAGITIFSVSILEVV